MVWAFVKTAGNLVEGLDTEVGYTLFRADKEGIWNPESE